MSSHRLLYSRGVACLIILISFVVLRPTSANAQSLLTFNLDTIFSSATSPIVPPSSVLPWVTAAFQNQSVGTVRLTMAVGNLPAGEYVDDWAFNLNPIYDPSNLNFTLIGTSPAVLMSPIAHATNTFKADGDGRYDINFAFTNANGAGRFTANEVLTYDLTLTGGTLTASDFNFLSAPSGGVGPFFVAAHINGIATPSGGTTSDWVTIPEPRSYVIILSLLAGAIVIVTRKSAHPLVARFRMQQIA